MVNLVFINGSGHKEARPVTNREEYLALRNAPENAKNFYDDRFDIVIANWKDCQKTFSYMMEKNRAYSLEEALIAADICQEGKAHDGFDDARNTALLFAKMEQNETLELNPVYKAARDDEVEHLGFSMGDLLAGIVLT